jgi:HEAT repeat protein
VAESAGRWLCLSWPLVPDLVCALDDEDGHVRRHVAVALGKLAPAAACAVPKLAGLLMHKDLVLAEYACWALGRIGKAARPALAALRRAARISPPAKDEWTVEATANLRAAAALAVQRILGHPGGPAPRRAR